jgi:divalent metal cation (Fe/Co/Zn/Cd) transporter
VGRFSHWPGARTTCGIIICGIIIWTGIGMTLDATGGGCA